jgi:hypothetical protein
VLVATCALAACAGDGRATDANPESGPPPLCGASFEREGGEDFGDALHRTDQLFGGLNIVRVFYQGLPDPWPGRPDTGGRPVVVSFKAPPSEILSRSLDGQLRAWFATAPPDRDVYWVYFHEPEDDIEVGAFSAEEYRAAWARLRAIADEAGNPRLRATLVLMAWTLDVASGREWQDYYPGRDVVQVLAWDVYNRGADDGRYDDPTRMFARSIEVTAAEGLAYGVAETGSVLVGGDDGSRRAEWLRAVTAHLTRAGALWVAYFDHDWPTGDYRLRDEAGVRAWRDFCTQDRRGAPG